MTTAGLANGGPRVSRERVVGYVSTTAILAIVLASLAKLASTGDALLGAVPMIIAILLYAVWTQPLRRTASVIIFAQCLFFSPYESDTLREKEFLFSSKVLVAYEPYASGPFWTYFFEPGNQIVNLYMNKIVDLPFLSLSGQELAYPIMAILIGLRLFRGDRTDGGERTSGANVLFLFLILELLMVGVLEVRGWSRGGDLRSTLFQMRTLIWLPIETFVLSYAFRTSRDFRPLAIAVTLAAILKVGFGLYFIWHDAWQKDAEPPFMTGHQDSVLYVAVIFFWFASWIHSRHWQRLLVCLVVAACMLIGIVVNNRRLAWVSLVATLLVFFPLLGGVLKRRVKIALICAAPFLVVYLAIARTHSGGIFAPGAELMGIANVEDSSTLWREMENFNLIATLSFHRIFGSGWGHEFFEIIALPSVSSAYSQYRLVAHNSILWVMGVSGMIGFLFLWMPVVVGIFLATRSYHFARSAYDRTAAASVIAIIACYVNQAWGDIGLAAAIPTVMLAAALALAGKLATETGAWPQRVSLLGRAPTIE